MCEIRITLFMIGLFLVIFIVIVLVPDQPFLINCINIDAQNDITFSISELAFQSNITSTVLQGPSHFL